jgi:adenosylmethionine---8-amino-7-oxononanoate aminotransferase
MNEKVWLPYTQMQTAQQPLHVSHVDKSRIFLKNGDFLIDGIASWWTACHGYRHPLIEEHVIRQLKKMPHIMLGGIIHEPVIELSNKLIELLPEELGHVFFSESGSVSVEVALKIAIQYQMLRGANSKAKFISFRNAYHGDTFAAMSVCDPLEGMHSKFSSSLVAQYTFKVPKSEEDFLSFESNIKKIKDNVAGMIIEPLVQAAGGMIFHSPDQLRRIADICKANDILVIFDEIATGFGRTGSMFAFEKANITPDLITLSKALTGGTLPLAATIATKKVFNVFLSEREGDALMHGPTYSGNPLACSAALASIKIFEQEPRIQQAKILEHRMLESLSRCDKFSLVRNVRSLGGIGVVELIREIDINKLRQQFIKRGVWIRPIGKIIYLMPALNIIEEELDHLCDAIVNVVSTL